MTTWQQRLYDVSPWCVKEWLVAAEAWRRNRYRRYGDIEDVQRRWGLNAYKQRSHEEIEQCQMTRAAEVVAHSIEHSPFYRRRASPSTAFSAMPVVTKGDLREHMSEFVAEDYRRSRCWKGMTSGSTGTPLRFLVAREGIRARMAIQDSYYGAHGCPYGAKRVRIAGAQIRVADCHRPPFWIMNRVDNQLQMSAYHLDEDSVHLYVNKLNEFRPLYLTGYAHSLYRLAQYLKCKGRLQFTPIACFTDSEALSAEQRETIEYAFGAPCYPDYGLGEVGLVAVSCREKTLHVLELSCLLEVLDDHGKEVPFGQTGRLVVTDLTQLGVPYIRYDTGDIGSLERSPCKCGWHGLTFKTLDGRSDDVIVTPQGRRVGRLSHVAKPGRGILESQIAHVAPTEVVIRVVPADDFDESSMKDVIDVANRLLGSDMKVSWQSVTNIPRTLRHKFKHVVREF